jgi:hypothetical protein
LLFNEEAIHMASIGADIQQILSLASSFSSKMTPAMRERSGVLTDLASNLETLLESPDGRPWRAMFDLRVTARNQQGSVALVPWVRVYSPRHAPTAQKGIYLTYLFAADGSRAYLSLMHGSSEWRSGSMRAISDRNILLTRTALARSALDDLLEIGGAAETTLSMDLGWKGHGSPERAKAYEHASILARQYDSGQIPADAELQADFIGMLPLLGRLYDETVRDFLKMNVVDREEADRLAMLAGRMGDVVAAEVFATASTSYQRPGGITYVYRVESLLITAYRASLPGDQKRTLRVPTGVADLYAEEPDGSVILEAKSSAQHSYVRQALSQLLDYVRFSPKPVVRLSALFPRCPDRLGIELLHDYGIGCIYLDADGTFASLPAPSATAVSWQQT